MLLTYAGPSRQRLDENLQSLLGKVLGFLPLSAELWERVQDGISGREDYRLGDEMYLYLQTSLIGSSQISGFLSSTHFVT